MNSKSNLFRLLMVLAIGSMIACGGQKNDTTNESAEFDAAKEELKESIEEVVYNIPSPAELPYMLEATGADFNGSFVNSKEYVDKYKSTFDKAALNLGIYAGDIGYLSSYSQTQDALEYLQAAKELADYLGVVEAVDEVVLQRFEENIDQRDSLYTIINNAIDNVDKYLVTEQRNRVAALVTTGSFIEGLYLSTELVRTYPKDLLPDDTRNLILTPVIKIIFDQEKSLNELIRLVSSVEQDELIGTIRTGLEELKANFEAINMEEQIKNNRADLMLTDASLTTITESVNKIRTDIIQ
jgi:hypothetical protein